MKTTALSRYIVTERTQRDAEKRTILISFKSSWGEVDAILPVLTLLKREGDVRIVAFFASKRFFELDTTMPYLDHKLTDVVDAVVRPIPSRSGFGAVFLRGIRTLFMRLRWRDDFAWLFHQIVSPSAVGMILEPVGPVRRIQERLREWCPGAPVIVFQHSTALLLNKPGEAVHRRDGDKPADAMLYSSPYGLEHLETMYPSIGRVIWTGFPRYDRWWIDQILADPEYHGSVERATVTAHSPVFALFTTHIREDVISAEAFARVVTDVAETVFSFPNSFLIVKPHPRLKGDVLETVLSRYPSSRWMSSGLQALQIGEIVDLVISMPSSTMLDNVVMTKPVIEYFDYSDLSVAAVFRTAEGDPCTEYVYAGYVKYARDRRDLQEKVTDLLGPTARGVTTEEYETAKQQLRLDDLSSRRSVDVIRGYLEETAGGLS